MDPLSATASIIAVISLADNIITRCRAYVSAVKDAPNDLCNILIEVGSVKCTLETLEMRRKVSPILQEIGNVDGPLEGCDRALKALAKLFPTESDRVRERKRGNLSVSYADLAWPFKEGKARKLLEDLGRHKTTIVLILTTDAGAEITKIKDSVEGIVDTLNDRECDSIFRWLVKTDPSSDHNRACQRHEAHTGQWLVRSTEYSAWLSGPIRFLWLHGIPGAGKTILASFIIQNVQRFSEASDVHDIGWAYYYCYFGRNQDESHPFLRWIISQLCRQLNYIPEELRRLKNRGSEPAYKDLLKVFSIIVGKFRRVYIVIDALDESQDRRYLLDLLIKTASDDAFEKVRLLAVSRKELDIQQAFNGICTSISLSNPLVDEDIRVYIENQLQIDRKLSRWPESLKNEIQDALVRGAKGMFRWVACQLDILARVNSRPEIRKALRDLPDTLEDAYERILAKIPLLNRSIAHKALQILAFHDFGFTIEEIAEAVIVNTDQCSFTTDSRLLDPTDLFEICTYLITVDEKNQVRLAHYSVAEYLTSERILDGLAATFKTSRNKANFLLMSTFLVYLQNLSYDRMPTAGEFFSCDTDVQNAIEDQMRKDYPLVHRALFNWAGRLWLSKGPIEGYLIELVLRLLDPRRDHFRGWEELETIFHRGVTGTFFRLQFPLGAELSATLAYLCHFKLTEVAEALLMRNLDSSILENRLEPCYDFLEHYEYFEDAEGTPLQVAAMTRNEHFARILIQYGADPNARHQGWTVLTSTLRSSNQFDGTGYGERNYRPVINLLLQAGASANPSGVCKTPLQLAVERDHNTDVVELLLAAGTYVNAVGNREAVIVDMEDLLPYKSTRQDSRSIESYYDTPLRIAEKKTNRYEPGTAAYGKEDERLAKLRYLLIQSGGISCHKSPQNSLQEATSCVHPTKGGD